MLRLYFCPQKFPRTITRSEWVKIYRWKRVTEKQLVETIKQELELLAAYGSTQPELYDRFINPPLLIHTKQEL